MDLANAHPGSEDHKIPLTKFFWNRDFFLKVFGNGKLKGKKEGKSGEMESQFVYLRAGKIRY